MYFYLCTTRLTMYYQIEDYLGVHLWIIDKNNMYLAK